MNVLHQLESNLEKCKAAVQTAEYEMGRAKHPFEKQAAQIELKKANRSLQLVQKLIIEEKCRQDEDEWNYIFAI